MDVTHAIPRLAGARLRSAASVRWRLPGLRNPASSQHYSVQMTATIRTNPTSGLAP